MVSLSSPSQTPRHTIHRYVVAILAANGRQGRVLSAHSNTVSAHATRRNRWRLDPEAQVIRLQPGQRAVFGDIIDITAPYGHASVR